MAWRANDLGFFTSMRDFTVKRSSDLRTSLQDDRFQCARSMSDGQTIPTDLAAHLSLRVALVSQMGECYKPEIC